MNYGRFFSLDYESSLFQNGMAVYYYREVEDKERRDDDNLSSRFPIYVTITKESIDFRMHYYSNKGEESLHTHLNNTILSLPISTNLEVKDRLTEVLAEAYSVNFPNNSNKKKRADFNPNRNYLYDLVKESAERIERKNLNNSPKGNGHLTSFYYNLDVFQKKNEQREESFLRKLILDFLFDWEHTKVFQTNPFYEYIFIKLRENFFLSALAAKANYYYHRELLKNASYAPDTKKFYAEQLLKTEDAWSKCIRNPKSDTVFNASQGWFDYPEKEMDGIYLMRNEQLNTLIASNDQNRTALRINNIASSKWYSKRYAFQNIASSIWGLPYHLSTILYLPLMLFCLCAILLPIAAQLFWFRWLFLAQLFFIVICTYIQNQCWKDYLFGFHLAIPRLMIATLIGWINIFFATNLLGLTIAVSDNTKNYLNTFLESESKLYNIAGSLSLCIFFFVWYQIGKYTPYWDKGQNRLIYYYNKTKRVFYFFSIGFVYAYLIGIIFFIFTSSNPIDQSIFFTSSNHPGQLTEIKKHLLFTFFAMFIGIFIQLTFEEKPMTEDL